MYRLSTSPSPAGVEMIWIEALPGVRIQFRSPEPTPMLLAARRAAAMVRQAGGALTDAEFAFTAAVACWGAVAWEGIGAEPAEGEDVSDDLLPLTPETLTQFLRAEPKAYDKVDLDYVTPAILLEQEKNGSSPSPNGTSEGAKATAGNAPASVPSAPTGPTKRKPLTGNASGA